MEIERAKSEIMQIYGMLSPDKQRAIDTLVHTIEQNPSNVREHDKDHIWYKGKQYISLKRFLQVKEPCEDAISRKAVIDELKKWDWQELYLPIHFKENIIDVIPSVNPQEPKYCDRNICIKNEYNGIGCDECEVTKSQEPKTGHWAHDGSYWKYRFICSECNYRLLDKPTNYCPSCGCKMESEDTV